MNLRSENFFDITNFQRQTVWDIAVIRAKAAKQPEKSCLYLGHNFFALVYLLLFQKKAHKEKEVVGWGVERDRWCKREFRQTTYNRDTQKMHLFSSPSCQSTIYYFSPLV